MPHWFKVPCICNAVCHFKRNLKHHAQKKKIQENVINFKRKKKNLKMNSVILKHKVQSSIFTPLPFPAYFIRNFTAIFYAHGITINMEVSSMESCSLFIFFFSCVWYSETNTMNIKSNCMSLSRLNISKHLGHFPSFFQCIYSELVRLADQSVKLCTFLPLFLRLVFLLLIWAIQDISELYSVFFPLLLYSSPCSPQEN